MNSDMNNVDGLLLACRHEASHAAVARALGVRNVVASVDPMGTAWKGSMSCESIEDPEIARVVALAGEVSDELAKLAEMTPEIVYHSLLDVRKQGAISDTDREGAGDFDLTHVRTTCELVQRLSAEIEEEALRIRTAVLARVVGNGGVSVQTGLNQIS